MRENVPCTFYFTQQLKVSHSKVQQALIHDDYLKYLFHNIMVGDCKTFDQNIRLNLMFTSEV